MASWMPPRARASAWAERSPLRWVAAALAVIGVVVGVDAFWVEPNLLFVNHHRVVSAKVTEPLRIAVLADIQTDAPGWRMRRAVRAAMDAAPDLLLLPGDYVQTNRRSEHDAAVTAFRAILSEEGLGAPLGAVAVRGNVEHDGWAPSVFGGLPVHAAEATARHSLGGGAVTVTALSFRDGFSTGLRVPAGAGLHVVVGHAPDFALGDIDADILVAGHTHGGQVRLPGIGPLVTFSRVPRAWAAGRTELPSGATLFVSRGVGMERATAPRLRFLCPPEVMIIDVTPGSP